MKWRPIAAFGLILILGAATLSRLERPGLAEESWTSIYYPQAALGSADELSFKTQLTLYNPQPESVTAIPLFIYASGEEQDWQPVTLGPNESTLLSLESDGPLSVGQIQLSTSAPIGESLKYVIAQADGTTREEISVGSTESARDFLLPVNNDGIHRSALAVANPGSEMLSLALTLFDSEGFIVQEGELQLPARGQLARYIHELEGFAFVKPGFIGSLRIQSSAPFIAMGLAENQSDNHLSSLRPFSPSNPEGSDQDSNSSFVANYPQSAYGFQVDSGLIVSTKLTVFNPHQEEVTVRALFFDHTGKLQQEVRSVVPPNGLRIIEPTAANLIVGQAQLIADRPVGQVLTYLFTNSQGRIVEEISVKETAPSKQYSIPVEISESHTSSFAVANVADRPITVHAYLVDENGDKGQETQFTLSRGEQLARFFSEVFSALDFFTGTAQFWSNEGDLVLMGLSTNRDGQHLSSLAGTPAAVDSSLVEVTLRAGDFNLSEISGSATFLLGAYEAQGKGHTTFWVPEGEYQLNIISPSHWSEVLDIRRGLFGEYGPIRDTADPPDEPVTVSVGSNGSHEEFVGLLIDNLETYRIPGLPFEAFYTKQHVFQFLTRDDGYKYEFVDKQAIQGQLENATSFDPTLAFQRWRNVVSFQNSYGKSLHKVLIDGEIASEAISAASLAQGTLVLQVSTSAFSEVELQSEQGFINSAVASVPISEATKWKTYAGQLLKASAGVRPIIVTDSGRKSQTVSVEDVLADGQDDLDPDVGLAPVAEKLTGLALHLRRDTFLEGQFVEEPGIQLKKATNGEDADTPPGPSILQGAPVSWTYEVLNSGNVLLSEVSVFDDREGPIFCDQKTLGAGESMVCTSEGVAEAGQYGNIGRVSAVSVLGTEVSAEDPSHYLGVDSCYLLTLSHTGSGSDPVPSPESSKGCASSLYHAGEIVTLTAAPESGWTVATWKNSDNDASNSNENQVTIPGSDLEVTVNYVEVGAAITIEKHTNEQDADTPPGPSLTIGEEVRWTFEVANTGNITLTDIIVTDDQLGSICDQNELGPAVEMTCVVTATANLGQHENIATAAGSPQGGAPDVSDVDPSHYLGVTDEADLRVTKSLPTAEISQGATLPYIIEVANLGPAVASSVILTDTLPTGTAFVSAPDQCSYGSGQVVCGLGDLEAEFVLPEIVIEVEFNTTGVITNTVEVAAAQDDPNPANDVFVAVNTVTPWVDLSVSKTASTETVMVGDQFFYTVDALNEGPSVATTVLITDTLPAEVEYLSASAGCTYENGAVVCGLGDLGSQAGASAEIEVRATTAGTLINTVEVAAQEPDANPSNNFSVHELTALATEPAIYIEKFTNGQDADTPPGPTVAAGDEVSWTFEVANTGNITLTNIIVTDDQLGSICSQEELGPAVEMTCVVTATAQLGQYENIGTALGSPQGGASDVSDVDPSHYLGVTDEADLTVTKSTPAGEVFEGDILPYSIDVANLGPSVASSVVITDTLPAGTGFVSASDQCSYSGGEVICRLGSLEVESGAQVVIEVEVGTTGFITNTVVVDADQPDPNPANSVFEAVNTVSPRVDLSVSKTASTDTVMIGDQFFYTVDALNEGPSVATTVLITDTLPAEVEYLSASAGCTYENGAVVCGLGDLGSQAGASVEIEVRATTAGTLINTVEVAAQEPDANPANNFSVHELTALATEPAIYIEKFTNGQDADQPPGPTITIGEEVRWTFEVANTGNITLTNVIVTDDQFGPVDCPQGELAPDESTLCSFIGTASAGQHSNIGTASGTPPGELPDVFDSDPSHYFGGSPSIVIEKRTNDQDADTPPGPYILAGNAVEWTYFVTNTGTVPFFDLQVLDDQLGVICAQPNLPIGGVFACEANGVAEIGQYSNVAMIDSSQAITATDASHYFGATPLISLEKSTNGQDADQPPGPTITIGEEVLWEFQVVNTGNVTLTNVIVTDDQLGSVDCLQDTLAPGESTLCSFVGTASAGQHSNTATASATPPGELPNVFDSDASHYLGIADEADLTVTKSAPPGEVYEGDVLPYLIEVANLGPQVASSVILTDTLPAGTALVSAPDECGYSSGEVVCGLGDLEAESHSQFVIEVEIGTTGFITNTVEVRADQLDPNPDNDRFETVNMVIPRVDLVVSKSASVESVFQGDNFIYFIEVENAGTSVATTVVLTDTLPVQAEYVSSSVGCIHNGGIVVCELGDLAGQAGGSAEIEVQATGGGTLFNTVETAAQEADVNPANNATFHELTALFPEPAITIEKYTNGQDADLAPGPTILVGEEVGWTYLVANTGNVTLTNIIVTDDRLGLICDHGPLGLAEVMNCGAITDTAQLGQYENTATVQATVVQTSEMITATDVSHYFGDAGP